jgi:hypothetical protein
MLVSSRRYGGRLSRVHVFTGMTPTVFHGIVRAVFVDEFSGLDHETPGEMFITKGEGRISSGLSQYEHRETASRA